MSTKVTLRPEGATDSSLDVVLGDGSSRTLENGVGPINGTTTVTVRDQPFNGIRADNTLFINRENRSGALSFSTSRHFSTFADAGRYWLTHGMTVAASGTLFFDFGDTSATPAGNIGVLFNVILRQIGSLTWSGKVVIGQYSVVYGSAAAVAVASLQTEINARRAVPSVSTAASVKCNCGGWSATDDWDADYGYEGTNEPAFSTNVIDDATEAPQDVYQTCRKGETFSYFFDLPDGNYDIKLHLAELVQTEAGEAVFSVSLNGDEVLTDFCIFTAAGDKDIANVQSFLNVAITGGLRISLEASVGLAQVNGIEITPAPEEEEE